MEEKWGSLPKDLLIMVTKRLSSNKTDILRVRAVCSSWHSSVPPTKNLPFQAAFVEPNNLFASDSKFPPFVLKQQTILLISPLDTDANIAIPWIIQVEEVGTNKLSLIDPFMWPKTHLPKCAELPSHIDLLDYNITEIHRLYYLDFGKFAQIPKFDYSVKRKAIKVTDDGVKANEYSVLFILDDYGNLFFHKPGMKEWIPIIEWRGHLGCFEIIRYKHKIYAVEYSGRFSVIDIVTCKVVQYGSCPSDFFSNLHVFDMAEFNGNLYFVTYSYMVNTDGKRYSSHVSVSAYILDEENIRWERTSDFGGGVFFMCHDCMFCVSSKELGLPTGDLVYFDGVLCYNQEVGRDGYCSVVYDMHSGKSYIKNWWPNRAPFWPPPQWIR